VEQEYSFIFVIIFLGFVLGSIVWSRSLKHQVGERTRELERAVRERLEFEDALLWESRVNAALADLASALISEPNIDEISNIVLDHAKRLTLSRFGYVGYIDPKTGALISPTLTRDIWANCQIPEKTFVFQKFLGLWGWVLINRKPLMTNSPNQDSRSTGSPEGHLPITKFLSVPALIEEKLVGQIALANSERDYREEDVKMVTRLASFYALALRRWEMEETIKISQKSFHSIVEATDEGIMVAEQNGVIRYVNRAVETLLNRKIEELINRPFRFSPGSESGSSLEIPLQGGEIKTIEIHKVATQ
jgi:PAS domain-containing protein